MGLRVAGNALLRRPPGSGIPTRPEVWGVPVSDPACRARSEGIFRAFFAGVDAGIRHPSASVKMPRQVEPLLAPFAAEGMALGQSLARSLTLRRPISMDRGDLSRDDPFAFLRVVGVGFSLGMLRSRRPASISRVAAGLGNYGPLVHDGYGFCTGLLCWRGCISRTRRPLDSLQGFERLAALNGLGRSLWFRWMDRSDEGVAAIRDAEDAPALLGGLGLAALFTFPDDPQRAYDVADRLPEGEKQAFLKGVRIALFVRYRDQSDLLEKVIGRQSESLRSRLEQDLRVALEAHETWHQDPQYIRRFHEACRGEGPDSGL
jgi:hypothetical protein